MSAVSDYFNWRRFALTCFKAGWLAQTGPSLPDGSPRTCERAFNEWYDERMHGPKAEEEKR